MKRILSIVAAALLITASMPAIAVENPINKAITDSKINRGAISVSVKDIKTGKELYKINEDKPVNPASTQKLVTTAASINTLGKDYKFETQLYKTTDNELFLKLGADPYLTSKDLKNIFSAAKAKNINTPKMIYIDDYILDSENWGEGWQWDDDLNPLMPKFGPYNLDNNLLSIIVAPTSPNSPAKIYPEVFYPLAFMNLVTTGKTTDVTISHNTNISAEMLQLEGTVQRLTKKTIPITNMKRYFRLRLEDAIADSKMEYYGKFAEKKLPQKNIYLVKTVEHDFNKAVVDILKNSNNMVAETVFKLAGGKFVNNTGSISSAIKMFNEYCSKQGLKPEDIKIVDGSGVSKNNLMTSDFMTDFLVAESKTEDYELFKTSMASPGEGTLENRMLYFKDNLKAKTGTLTDVSAIAGYLKTRSGNDVAFDIMINDPKSKAADKKMLEEYIIRAIYITF